jgi:hypothetical protein
MAGHGVEGNGDQPRGKSRQDHDQAHRLVDDHGLQSSKAKQPE